MSIKPIGDLPLEAEELRSRLEEQLPDILSYFSQALVQQFGLKGVRVGGFTVVPTESVVQNLSCDENSCSID